jgi:hypothetical protein
MPPPSLEYLVVLRAVVTKLLEVMSEPRLPDLSAEEIEYWFHGVRVEDIEKALFEPEENAFGIAGQTIDSPVAGGDGHRHQPFLARVSRRY